MKISLKPHELRCWLAFTRAGAGLATKPDHEQSCGTTLPQEKVL